MRKQNSRYSDDGLRIINFTFFAFFLFLCIKFVSSDNVTLVESVSIVVIASFLYEFLSNFQNGSPQTQELQKWLRNKNVRPQSKNRRTVRLYNNINYDAESRNNFANDDKQLPALGARSLQRNVKFGDTGNLFLTGAYY